ncbi:MAG: prepilin-type N-terminal cleavage/methylation domain-containing protein [Parcubacteria group bacterium]|nr:prepilin-type N-terminal cleavage/methylation domain-containing protein [Parcubacteria group bacterium]
MVFSKFQIPNSKFQRKTAGFSLIELMVTTSVIVIISSIVLFNFPSFASRILLENLTHEIALVVRQAQVYGIGIKQTTGGLFPAYGAHFDITATPLEDPPNKKVIFFSDVPAGAGNGRYDVGEELETFTIQRGNIISGLCYDTSCISAGVTTIDITFKRPEPEAHIRVNGSGGDVSSARITISPPSGSEIGDRFIYVYSSGQIAVTAE